MNNELKKILEDTIELLDKNSMRDPLEEQTAGKLYAKIKAYLLSEDGENVCSVCHYSICECTYE